MNRKQLINVVKSIKDIRNNATDEQALSVVYIYPEWNAEKEYAVGDRVQYNDTLYKCLQAHTAQIHWTPIDATSLWAKVLIPSEDKIYEWEQPKSTNPYMIGDKVTFNGKIYESIVDNNVWSPDTYGWKQI